MATKKKQTQTVDVEGNQLRDYEMVFIVNPEISDEALETTVNSVSNFVTGKGGAISSIDMWGKRRLAYPLSRFSEGNYVLAQFKMDPAWSKELETTLHISEDVLRHLLIRLSD